MSAAFSSDAPATLCRRRTLGTRFAVSAELEALVEDFSVRLVRVVPGPKLVRRGKRVVAVPQVPAKDLPRVDVAKLIEEERNRWPW